MKTDRPSFNGFKAKAFENIEVKKEYDEFTPLFVIKKQFVATRLEKGITQEQIAQKIGTKKSNISRLESLNNSYSPNITTLIKYAQALGLKLDIRLS